MLIEASYRKAIEHYYATLDELAQKQVSHELGMRPAFQNLLATVGKRVGWTLVPEQRLPNGRVPDGTLRDSFLLPRGYWEAKDTADDLDNEVKKKIAAGYPLTNTIFKDTHRAVLYQDGQRRLKVEMRRKEQLADLLHAFTTHAEPDIEQFEQAVTEFKARIPFSWRVEKMKLTRDKDAVIVNDSLTLAGIPPEVYNYRLGNRSALEWVIDQYRVTTDKRSGITSDPNREDDKEYIVRLVGRVVTVSLETVRMVEGLPDFNIWK